MKIAIIYSTSTKTTKKACKILSGKLNADVQLIPIEMAKTECLLKYNFIILAVSSYNGKVQSIFKRYISHNIKTLKERPIALVINCEEDKDRFKDTFSEELVNSSYITSNFGYELNADEGNIFEKRKVNKLIQNYEKNGKNLPKINLNEIDKFSDYINDLIEKRVG